MDPATMALLGSALAKGVGGLIGGMTQGDAASRAAQAQADAARAALEFQKGVYTDAQGNITPYIQAGQETLPQYQAAVGGLTRPDFAYTQKDFNLANWKDPGYDYRMSEAQKTIEASSAKKGMSLGSGVLKDLQTRSQDMASQEYRNAYKRYLDQSNILYGQAKDEYGRDIGFQQQNIENLGNLAGTGLKGAESLAGIGGNAGSQIGQSYQNLGEAQAYGILGPAKVQGDMYGSWGTGLSDILKQIYSTTNTGNPGGMTWQ